MASEPLEQKFQVLLCDRSYDATVTLFKGEKSFVRCDIKIEGRSHQSWKWTYSAGQGPFTVKTAHTMIHEAFSLAPGTTGRYTVKFRFVGPNEISARGMKLVLLINKLIA